MKLFCNLDKKTIIITESQRKKIQEMIAYHGSKMNFDEFNLAYMGTGVGTQEFGEGIYLTFDKEAAYGYGGTIYTVNIPDENKANYIYYDRPIPSDLFSGIIDNIIADITRQYPDEYTDEQSIEDLKKELYDIMDPSEGRHLMYNIHRYIDDSIVIPKILKSAGVTGFIYNNGKVNNVIMFSSRDIKILDKETVNESKNYINETIEKINQCINEEYFTPNELLTETKKYYANNSENIGIVAESFLIENRESKNMSKARKYIRSVNPNVDAQQLIDSIRTDIPNSRIADCKFLMGVSRMYLNGELRDQMILSQLNQILKFVGSEAHVNEYDQNLNNETAQTLIERFATSVQSDIEKQKQEVNSQEYQINNDYQIIPIKNFKEAKTYGRYTSWCVTHDKSMFDRYTHSGTGRFYFCLKNGFQNVPPKCGQNCPLDEYGLSMIAVSVNDDGSCNTITCRWNHDNGGNDNIMTDKELSHLIGRNFYQVFKPYTKEELKAKGIISIDMIQNLLEQGVNPKKIFSSYSSDKIHNMALVQFHNDKWNYLDVANNKILSPNLWFDYAFPFKNGFGEVRINGKWNFITIEGKILSQKWFDDVHNFSCGFAPIQKNGKWNYINQYGELLSPDCWFEDASVFKSGKGKIRLNGHGYRIDDNGKYYDWNYNKIVDPFRTKNENKIINQKKLIEEIKNDIKRLLFESYLLEAELKDIYPKYYNDIPQDIFWNIIKTDPTYDEQRSQKMGKYGKWLLNQYRQGNLDMNNLSKVRNTIDFFNRYNRQLEVKDINQYKNIDQVYDNVKNFMEDPSQATSKSDEVRKIKEMGAEKVYEDNDWLIIVPKTQKAAIYYGKGTKWCTASTSGYNYFENYNKEGRLYININKKTGDKYQFHFETNSFMDAEDKPITGIIAEEIGLSSGAEQFYASLGEDQEYAISSEEHTDPDEEPEEEEILNQNGWQMIYNNNTGEITIHSDNENEDCMIFDDGSIEQMDGYPIVEPLHEFLPVFVIEKLQEYYTDEAFYKMVLADYDPTDKGFDYYPIGNNGAVFKYYDDINSGVLYRVDEQTYQFAKVIDFISFDLKLKDKISRGNIDNLILLNEYNEQLCYNVNTFTWAFDEPVDKFCFTNAVKATALKNGQGFVKIFKNNTVIQVPLYNNMPINTLDYDDYANAVIVEVLNNGEKAYAVYSVAKNQYVNNKLYSYACYMKKQNAIAMVSDRSERISDYDLNLTKQGSDYMMDLFYKYGYIIYYNPDSSDQIIFANGKSMTREHYFKLEEIYDFLVSARRPSKLTYFKK